jgi:uncharacterized protein YabE (DUF348 family)
LIPLAESIKRYFSPRELLIVLLAVIVSVSAGVGFFNYMKKEAVITCDGRQISVKTMKATVGEVLEQNGISVKPEDFLNVPLDSKLHRMKKNEIVIERAVPITIVADGKETELLTYRKTVGEAIKNSSIRLESSDRLEGAKLEDRIAGGMVIKIVRIKEDIVVEKEPIPFKVISRPNHRLDQGKEKTVKEGSEGIREKQYKVTFEDGKEVARNLIKDFIAVAPIDSIVELGTVLNHKTARGDVVRYKKVLNMRATAYTASFKDTGKHPDHPEFGITYTGIRARKGIIAVDPKVIPLGTRVYVEVAGSTPDYGYAVAADIGGAIKGNLIDLYMDDQKTVDRWGVKKVKVYILADQ